MADLAEEQQVDEFTVLRMYAARALREAPELIGHIRSMVFPSDGRSEPGVEMRVESTPLLTGVVDDADAAYSILCLWRSTFAPPSEAPAVWVHRGSEDPAGFRAGTSAEDAIGQVQQVTSWLLENDHIVVGTPVALTFYSDVVEVFRALRGRYPLQDRNRARSYEQRPCPLCGESTVYAVWYSESTTELTIRCAHCGADTAEILGLLRVSAARVRTIVARLDGQNECPTCQGSGVAAGGLCVRCGGAGQVWMREDGRGRV